MKRQGPGTRRGITRRSATAGLVGGVAGAALAGGPGQARTAAPALPASDVTAPDHDCAVTLPPGSDRAFMQGDGAASWLNLQGRADAQTGYYTGWTEARRRVLADWSLLVDGTALARAGAEVTVTRLRTVRHWPAAGVTECCWLAPGAGALVIEVGAPSGTRLGLEPLGCGAPTGDMLAVWQAQDPAGGMFGRFIHRGGRLEMLTGEHVVAADGAFLVFIHADTVADLAPRAIAVAAALSASLARAPASAAPAERAAQIAAATSFQGTSDFARALQWTQATLGQLTSTQQGAGLYAGLPWFDDFWGRDTFISFIGTYLIPGRFDEALAVLQSFAQLQDTDPASRTYGRIPNRARPDEIIYNTADGTPRWVIAIDQFTSYGGDRAAARALWPAVRRAYEGAMRNWVDGDGFLTHDDADSWMDAKENGVRPLSPRGNRACDVQVLWWLQVDVTSRMATAMGERALAEDCDQLLTRLLVNFPARFLDRDGMRLADRLRADGSADWSMRPNHLFALRMLQDQTLAANLARKAWQQLVYPWGVASLAQDDPAFHPWHEPEGLWPKDEAYHNGTIWLWLGGIACEHLLSHGEVDLAFALIKHWAGTTLAEDGTIGCLPELRDALPRPGAIEGRPSGTWQQAWSGAELTRVVRERVMGVRPLSSAGPDRPGHWLIRPCLPAGCPDFAETMALGPDSRYRFAVSDGGRRCTISWVSGPEVSFALGALFPDGTPHVAPTDWVRAAPAGADGRTLVLEARDRDPARLAAARTRLVPVSFAQPVNPEDTPVLKTWRARQLPGAPAGSGDSP